MEPVPPPHSTWRVVAAFLIAPLAAAAAMACLEPGYGLTNAVERIYRTAIFYSGAYPSTIILGLPTFLFLRRKVAASPLNCVLAGAFVADAPWTALLIALSFLNGQGYSASFGGHDTIVDGHTTVWGWIELGKFSLELAAFGAFGGLIFWLIAAARPQIRTGVAA
jgi:hypothetical protein